MQQMLKYWAVIPFLAAISLVEAHAQRLDPQEPSRDQQVRAHIDSALTARYYRTLYDTNYVVRPEGKVTLKVRLNQTGNDFHAKGTVSARRRGTCAST